MLTSSLRCCGTDEDDKKGLGNFSLIDLWPNVSLIGGELFKGSYKEMKHIRDLFQVLYCSKQIPILMQCHPSPGGCKRFAHVTREGSSDCRNSGATKLKSLLGLLSYNSRFLPNMATMLARCISY